MVFFSCCDAVEYLHRLFDDVFESTEGERLVSCPLYKLHGNLPQVRLRFTSSLLCVQKPIDVTVLAGVVETLCGCVDSLNL